MEGIYLHAGSGTAESDSLIRKLKRTFIALDLVVEPLRLANKQANSYLCVVADIKQLPFDNESLDGIWNVGVHEHFSSADNQLVLKEYYRVLKANRRLLIFWPGRFTPYMILKDAVEFGIRLFIENFQFFPDEINKARSKKHVATELEAAGFRVRSIKLSWRDLFVFYAAVAAKPS